MSLEYSKNEQGWYVCSYCNEVKEKQSTMCMHIRRHRDKQYECSNCKKKFSEKISLKNHMARKHKDKDVKKEEEDSFECPFENCDFKEQAKGNLRTHCLRKHFKDEINSIMEENNTCVTCKRSFNSNVAFYYHALGCIRVNDPIKQKIIESIT